MSFTIPLIAVAFYSMASVLLSRSLADTESRTDKLQTAVVPGHVPVNHPAIPGSRRKRTLAFAFIAVLFHAWVVINQTGLPDDLTLPLLTSFVAPPCSLWFCCKSFSA